MYMKTKETPAPRKPARSVKAAVLKKKAAPKRAAAAPAPDSDWVLGPYGEIISKEDFAAAFLRPRDSQ
jgi:hypothetical protein